MLRYQSAGLKSGRSKKRRLEARYTPHMQQPRARNTIVLILFLAVSQAAGLIGTIFTVGAIPTWYAALVKPSFSPPDWLFGPVWAILYALIGIAAFILWRERTRLTHAARALNYWWLQLFLNAIWSPIFFGYQHLGLALIVIIFLWLAIAATMWQAWKAERLAAYLLIPYLAWVSFATALNLALWQLN